MPISKRSRRDQRLKHPRPIRFTERDIAILQAIYEYRVLSAYQIQQLFFRGLVKARARLNVLYQHGFIDRKFSGVYFDKMNTPILYILDRRGAEVLHAVGKLPRGWHRKSKQVSLLFLQHTLTINNIRIAVVKACQQQGIVLQEWRDESTLKQGYDHVNLPELTQPVAVIPDSYFRLKTPTTTLHFFLEVDRSTETNKVFKRKIAAYQLYCGSDAARLRFGTTKFRVLTITQNAARLTNLKRTTEGGAGKNRFWFTTLAQATEENILTAPIWKVAGREEPTALIY